MKSGWQGLCDSRCSRRAFVQAGAGALALLSLPARPARAQAMQYGLINPHPASFYREMDQGLVQCQLCPRKCVVLPGDRGECGVRENREGKYYSLVYGCLLYTSPSPRDRS